jgi:general secretion pathway protein E
MPTTAPRAEALAENPKPGVQIVWADQGELLTASGGRLAEHPFVLKNADLRKRLAAFQSGLLLVGTSFAADPLIDQFRAVANDAGYRILRIQAVSLDEIDAAYRHFESRRRRRRKNPEANQRRVLAEVMAAYAIRSTDVHCLLDPNRQRFEIKRRVNRIREKAATQHDDSWGVQFIGATWEMSEGRSHTTYMPAALQSARLSAEEWELPSDIAAIRLQFNPSVRDGGRALFMRLLYTHTAVQTFEAMGYHPSQQAILEELAQIDGGMFAPSGKTGSAKSTLIALMLNVRQRFRQGRDNIVTAEDPVEFPIIGANQISVQAGTDTTSRTEAYVAACAALLRSDPDVAMGTELRDPASSQILFSIAESGVPLFSSSHADSFAEQTLRLEGQGIPAAHWSSPNVMRGLCNQRLVARLCPKCAIRLDSLTEEEAVAYGISPARYRRFLDTWGESAKIPSGETCGHAGCFEGYAGSTVIAEVAKTDYRLLSLLANHNHEGARQYWTDSGYLTRAAHAALKILAGETSPADAEALVGLIGANDIAYARRVDAAA